MNIPDRCLDIYLRKVLGAAAFLPPPSAYKILPYTGHLFRNFRDYACGYETGAFFQARQNLEDVNILPSRQIKEVLKEYLRFETRYVLENIWVRRHNRQHVIQSFNNADIISLKKLIRKQNYVIITAHFSGLIDMVELLRVIGYKATLIASNPMNLPWNFASPIQRSMVMLYRSWMQRQSLIFSDEKNIMDKSCKVLLSEESVIIAADVPGYQGARVSMFGKSLWVPAGSAIMAWKCNVPILVAIPWASACDKPYKIFLRTIPASQDTDAVMTKIFEYIETVVRLNPAAWNGWMYFHRMLAT
jgi:lauroyl/myristoyl acyltransferase